jgi:branched-chain amino acid transport system ATP-binding protein
MLKMQDVHAYYDLAPALKGVSLEVNEGEIVSVLGPNGAGKTTTVHAIMGVIKVKSGKILLGDRDITGKKPHQIVELGISLVPEGRLLFPQMTVEENLNLGASTAQARSKYSSSLDSVFLLFPRLRERRHQAGGTLSGGEQQMLAIGRALMSTPKLLMLDEPSLGLAPTVVRQIFSTLNDINKQGTTIFLVEQNVNQALTLSTRGYVLENGRVVLEGKSSELLNNPFLKEAYLGL